MLHLVKESVKFDSCFLLFNYKILVLYRVIANKVNLRHLLSYYIFYTKKASKAAKTQSSKLYKRIKFQPNLKSANKVYI